MDVLVTGGNGTVGTAILDGLADRPEYSFTNVDIEESDDLPVESVVADIQYYDEIRPHFEGVDAVVHLAYVSNMRRKRHDEAVIWSRSHVANLQQCASVFRAAIDAGVERFVYASSNHAVGMYEDRFAPDIYEPEFDMRVDHTVPPQPDSMYGVMNVYGELLGRMAAEYHGTRVYAWRICNVAPPHTDTPRAYAERLIEEGADPDSEEYRQSVARKKAMWHSRRDVAHIVDCFLQDDTVEFDIFYGVSDNDARWFDIEHAREVVGYDPADNGAEWDCP